MRYARRSGSGTLSTVATGGRELPRHRDKARLVHAAAVNAGKDERARARARGRADRGAPRSRIVRVGTVNVFSGRRRDA